MPNFRNLGRIARLGVQSSSLVAVCWLGVSCVGQTQYEEARSAAEVRSEEHRRAQLQIAQLKQDLARLQAELVAREDSISRDQERLAQADLELEVANQKQTAKGYLVDRLRDDLARAGDHLKAFADEKEQIRQELVETQAQAAEIQRAEQQIARVASIVRDLSVLEGDALGSGEIELSTEQGQITLRAPATSLVGSGTKRLEAAGQRLAASLGKLGSLHHDVGFALGDTSSGSAHVGSLRLLSDAIEAEGVSSERIDLEARAPSTKDAAEAQIVIRIDFSAVDGAPSEPDAEASEAETDLGGPTAG